MIKVALPLLHCENFYTERYFNKKFIKSIIHRFDYIIPLAALVGAPLCEKFKKALDTNLNAIKFLLKNMKKKQRIIYMNSNSGYGIGDKKNIVMKNHSLIRSLCMVELKLMLKNM